MSPTDTSSPKAPIVGSPSPSQVSPVSRSVLAQIRSSEPIVASSGSAPGSPARPAAHRGIRPTGPISFTTGDHRQALKAPVAVTSTVEINAPGVHLFISPSSIRRPPAPGGRTSPSDATAVRQIGSAGLAGLLPSTPRPVPSPAGPANATLFGNAPGPAGGSSLLGIDALFTIAVLLVGAAWRRRAWDLPVLPSQSAVLSLALDRPG